MHPNFVFAQNINADLSDQTIFFSFTSTKRCSHIPYFPFHAPHCLRKLHEPVFGVLLRASRMKSNPAGTNNLVIKLGSKFSAHRMQSLSCAYLVLIADTWMSSRSNARMLQLLPDSPHARRLNQATLFVPNCRLFYIFRYIYTLCLKKECNSCIPMSQPISTFSRHIKIIIQFNYNTKQLSLDLS